MCQIYQQQQENSCKIGYGNTAVVYCSKSHWAPIIVVETAYFGLLLENYKNIYSYY